MKLFHHAVLALALGALTSPLLAQTSGGIKSSVSADWLVSPAEAIEFKGETGYTEPVAQRLRAIAPLIEIIRPEPVADLKVKAPFTIEVTFKAQNDAAIDPSTFKVMYGALKFDITSRITKVVTVSPKGFTVDNAQIPPGKHRLILQVFDEKQRVAERDLRIEVE